jgi:hypothetical protein
MDIRSIILQLTGQLSDSPLEEERITELIPIDYVMEYYHSPFLGFEDPRNGKKHIIEWNSDKERIKELKQINKVIAEYNKEADANRDEWFGMLPKDGKVHTPAEVEYEKATIPFQNHPLWAFSCFPKLSRDRNSRSGQLRCLSPLWIDDEKLYNTFLEISEYDFIEYLNKEIFIYIQGKVQTAMKIGAWDSNNMWFEPYKMFLQWIELKGIDPESKDNRIPDFLSKWAKEVVRFLQKKGEMKHQDILLSIKGLPNSYNHISQIFKTRDAKEFFNNEIVNDNSYYSLRDPTQFKKQ